MRTAALDADRGSFEVHQPTDGNQNDTRKSGAVTRATNCVHAAAVELKSEGANDYWMYGHAAIAFDDPSVRSGPTGLEDDTSGSTL